MNENVKQLYVHLLKNNHIIETVVKMKGNEFRVCIVVRNSTMRDCVPAIYKLESVEGEL